MKIVARKFHINKWINSNQLIDKFNDISNNIMILIMFAINIIRLPSKNNLNIFFHEISFVKTVNNSKRK